MKPVRIQRKRTKGWKMPKNTVYVGRGSKWGNPYKLVEDKIAKRWLIYSTITKAYVNSIRGKGLAYDYLIAYYKNWLQQEINNGLSLSELKGKNLACWCPLDQPCHADVLLELANQE